MKNYKIKITESVTREFYVKGKNKSDVNDKILNTIPSSLKDGFMDFMLPTKEVIQIRASIEGNNGIFVKVLPKNHKYGENFVINSFLESKEFRYE